MTQNATAYHANNAYRSAAVAVPPLKAVVMLCDGAITLLQKALDAHDAKPFRGRARLSDAGDRDPARAEPQSRLHPRRSRSPIVCSGPTMP